MTGNAYLDFEGFWDLQVEEHGLKQQEGVQPLAREHQWQLCVKESGAEKQEISKLLSGNLSWFRKVVPSLVLPLRLQTTLSLTSLRWAGGENWRHQRKGVEIRSVHQEQL